MEELLVVVICLTLNALFSCFEMAFVTVNKAQLRLLSKTSRSASKILKLRENPERTLSVIQVGITLVGMISAAVSGAGAEESFAPILENRFGLSENQAEAVAILSVVLPLTFFSVVLGELVPKTIALRHPISISMLGSRWITLADKIFSPIVSLLEYSTKLVVRLLPKRQPSGSDSIRPDIEIESLSQPTQQYILNLATIENKKVADLMVPWKQVSLVSTTETRSSVVATVITSGHTRLPVVDNGQVVGLLHTKEFMAMLATTDENWQAITRTPLVVPSNSLALATLRLMQAKRTNLVVVQGDKGEALGIITLVDIIEEIVGDIYDEDDDGRIRKLLATNARWRRA